MTEAATAALDTYTRRLGNAYAAEPLATRASDLIVDALHVVRTLCPGDDPEAVIESAVNHYRGEAQDA